MRRGTLDPDRPQRAVLEDWDRTLIESGLPVAGLDAPRPKARFAIAAPLVAAIPGEAELVDLWLVERYPRWQVREALETRMPPSHVLVDLQNVWLGEPALPGRVAASVFRATLRAGTVDAAVVVAAAASLVAASVLPRQRRKGDATIAYDLRPFLDGVDVRVAPDGTVELRMTLRHDPEKGIGRPDEVLAALGERVGGVPLIPDALVRERLVLADPQREEAPKRAPGRRPLDRSPGTGPERGPRRGSDAARRGGL